MNGPVLTFPQVPAAELEHTLWEIESNEWCDAVAQFESGERMTVTFVTPVRAAQEIEAAQLPCYTEHRLMIVPDTTLKTMQKAVRFAYERGIFGPPVELY